MGGRKYVVMTIEEQVLQLQVKDSVAVAIETNSYTSPKAMLGMRIWTFGCVENIRGLYD